LPEEGRTMLEIYQSYVGDAGDATLLDARRDLGSSPASDDEGPERAYTRSAENEIDALFVRLANPDLVMYIFPHLATDENVPIPGYSTVFPMYERVIYALPGEVP
jgi:conjugative transfer region lipoprotein (TIGR03751 family)